MTEPLILNCDELTNDDIAYLIETNSELIEMLYEAMDTGEEISQDELDELEERLDEILSRCVSSQH